MASAAQEKGLSSRVGLKNPGSEIRGSQGKQQSSMQPPRYRVVVSFNTSSSDQPHPHPTQTGRRRLRSWRRQPSPVRPVWRNRTKLRSPLRWKLLVYPVRMYGTSAIA